jgi:hypothetical protein
VLAEVLEPKTFGERALDQGSGRVGDHDLPPVGGGCDARGPVHIDPAVVIPDQYALPGV